MSAFKPWTAITGFFLLLLTATSSGYFVSNALISSFYEITKYLFKVRYASTLDNTIIDVRVFQLAV